MFDSNNALKRKSDPKKLFAQNVFSPAKRRCYIAIPEKNFAEIMKQFQYLLMLEPLINTTESADEAESRAFSFERREVKVYVGYIVAKHLIIAKMIMLGQSEEVREKIAKQYADKLESFLSACFFAKYSNDDYDENFWGKIEHSIKQSMLFKFNEDKIKESLGELFYINRTTALVKKEYQYILNIIYINRFKNRVLDMIGFSNQEYSDRRFESIWNHVFNKEKKLFRQNFEIFNNHPVIHALGFPLVLLIHCMVIDYLNPGVFRKYIHYISQEIAKAKSPLDLKLTVTAVIAIAAIALAIMHCLSLMRADNTRLDPTLEKKNFDEHQNDLIEKINDLFGANKKIKYCIANENGIITSTGTVLTRSDQPFPATQWDNPQTNTSTKTSRPKRRQQLPLDKHEPKRTEKENKPVIVNWLEGHYPAFDSSVKDCLVDDVEGKGLPAFRVFSHVPSSIRGQLAEYGCLPILKHTKILAADQNEQGITQRKSEKVRLFRDGTERKYDREVKWLGQGGQKYRLYFFEAAKGTKGETLLVGDLLKIGHKNSK
jgi:hypothetical protein